MVGGESENGSSIRCSRFDSLFTQSLFTRSYGFTIELACDPLTTEITQEGRGLDGNGVFATAFRLPVLALSWPPEIDESR